MTAEGSSRIQRGTCPKFDRHIVEESQRNSQTPYVKNHSENRPAKRRKLAVKKLAPRVEDGHLPDLTESELKFCREYTIDHNASRAYRVCFPTRSADAARANASRLLTKANIQREIAALTAEHFRATKISARKVLRELAAIAFSDIGELYTADANGMSVPRSWDEIPPVARRAIQSIKVKRRGDVTGRENPESIDIDIRLHSKLDALDKLCRHLGLMDQGSTTKQLLDAIATSRPSFG